MILEVFVSLWHQLFVYVSVIKKLENVFGGEYTGDLLLKPWGGSWFDVLLDRNIITTVPNYGCQMGAAHLYLHNIHMKCSYSYIIYAGGIWLRTNVPRDVQSFYLGFG